MSLWSKITKDKKLLSLIEAAPVRVVEAQHHIGTRKLVSTDEEQNILEELLEKSKPKLPKFSHLHYLLSTPFRYPPLPYGSRFGTRARRGIWYGSIERETAFYEIAHYRFLFIEGSKAPLLPMLFELTVFRARVKSAHSVDLTKEPFLKYRSKISSPRSHQFSQTLGSDMRDAGVQMCLYFSARRKESTNIAVFDPSAFGRSHPYGFERWRAAMDHERFECTRSDSTRQERFFVQKN